MEKENYTNKINEILKTVDRLISKYEGYTDIDKIKIMISDSASFTINDGYIRGKQKIVDDIKSTAQLEQKLKNTKKNVYKKDVELDVIAMLMLSLDEVTEQEKDVARAEYNLISNNEIFRFLNYILNKNNKNNQFIKDNFKILKLNVAFFLINYYFEKIRDELMDIMKKDSHKINDEMNKLCSKYADSSIIQLMYEVLISNYNSIPKEFKSKSPLIGKYLKENGVTGDRDSIKSSSKFIFIRNAASHGEIYPMINEETVIVKNTPKGKEQMIREYSFDDIIKFAIDITLLFDNKDTSLFHQVLFSNDYIDLEDKINHTTNEVDLLKQFGALLLFNIIQYNNEHHFQLIAKDSEIKQYIDKINIKEYFSTSFDKNSKNIYDFMEVIKNAIGHMNIDLSGDELIFTNTKKNEFVTTSLVKLYEFVLQSDIYILTSSTIYFDKLKAKKEKILNALQMNNNINALGRELFGDDYGELEGINEFKDINYDNSYYNNKL